MQPLLVVAKGGAYQPMQVACSHCLHSPPYSFLPPDFEHSPGLKAFKGPAKLEGTVWTNQLPPPT